MGNRGPGTLGRLEECVLEVGKSRKMETRVLEKQSKDPVTAGHRRAEPVGCGGAWDLE